MKTKITKSIKTVAKKLPAKKAAPKKIKVAAPAKIKNKINVGGAITAVDEEFNNFLANQKTKQTNNSVPVAAPRRKEKFVDPGILMRLEAARGIIKDVYTLPTIKQFNQAVKDGRLSASPIVEK